MLFQLDLAEAHQYCPLVVEHVVVAFHMQPTTHVNERMPTQHLRQYDHHILDRCRMTHTPGTGSFPANVFRMLCVFVEKLLPGVHIMPPALWLTLTGFFLGLST